MSSRSAASELPIKVRNSLTKAQMKQIDSVREIRPDFSELQAYDFCNKYGFSASDMNEAMVDLLEASPSDDSWQVIDKTKKKVEAPAAARDGGSTQWGNSTVQSSSSASQPRSYAANASATAPVGARRTGNKSAVVNLTLSLNSKSSTPDLSKMYAAAAAAGPDGSQMQFQTDDDEEEWEQPVPEIPQPPPVPLQGAWGSKSFVELVKKGKVESVAAVTESLSAAVISQDGWEVSPADVTPASLPPPPVVGGSWASGNPLTRKAAAAAAAAAASPAVMAEQVVEQEQEQVEDTQEEAESDAAEPEQQVEYVSEPIPEPIAEIVAPVVEQSASPQSTATAQPAAISPEMLQQLLSQYGLALELNPQGQLAVTPLPNATTAAAPVAAAPVEAPKVEAVQSAPVQPQVAAPIPVSPFRNPAEQYYDPQAAAAMSSYYQMYQQQAQQQMYADQFAFNHFGYGQMAPLNPNSAPFQMPDASAQFGYDVNYASRFGAPAPKPAVPAAATNAAAAPVAQSSAGPVGYRNNAPRKPESAQQNYNNSYQGGYNSYNRQNPASAGVWGSAPQQQQQQHSQQPQQPQQPQQQQQQQPTAAPYNYNAYYGNWAQPAAQSHFNPSYDASAMSGDANKPADKPAQPYWGNAPYGAQGGWH